VTHKEAPYDPVKMMRARSCAGPLVAFRRGAGVAAGGCAIGTRPVDQHIRPAGFGADITVEHGHIVARATRLKGRGHDRHGHRHRHREPADGGDLAEGDGARERPRSRLAEMLIAGGGRASRATEPDPIEGVRPHGVAHRTIPDRIEAGTFCAAAQVARCCCAAPALTMSRRRSSCAEAGATIEAGEGWIRIRAEGRPRAVSCTSEYPAFPTTCRPSSWR
jgi:UDP-N-acetylglucosamine 1-carboxyvinyltransferase